MRGGGGDGRVGIGGGERKGRKNSPWGHPLTE